MKKSEEDGVEGPTAAMKEVAGSQRIVSMRSESSFRSPDRVVKLELLS